MESDFAADEAEILQSRLTDRDAQVRELAAKAVWELPESRYVPLLCGLAQDDPDEQVRCQAIRTLGRYIYEGELADYDFGPMSELLRDEELPREDFERVKAFLLATYRDERKPLDERRYALEALSFSHDSEVIALIEEAYSRPENTMKLSAIFAMGRNGGNRWTDMIRKEMYNPDPKLQWEAIRSAGEAGMAEVGKDLWRLTFSEDRHIQLVAIWALGQSHWESAFERLEDLSLDDSDPEIQEAADAALEEWLMYTGQLDDLASEYDDFDLV